MLIDLRQLSQIADLAEAKAGATTTAARTATGYWRRIALAAETSAGASTSASATRAGWMKRAALAYEALADNLPASLNQWEPSYEARIATATGVLGGGSYSGSYASRIIAALTAWIPGGEVTPTPTTNLSTFDDNGVTWNFAGAVPVGYYASGDPFAVNAANVTALPATTTYDGAYSDATAYTGRVINGMERDPGRDGAAVLPFATGMSYTPSPYPQGLDSLMPKAGSGEPAVPYDAARNVDGTPQNGVCTLVKAVSKQAGVNTLAMAKLTSWSFLTVVDAVPPEGSFRRWPGNIDKTPIFFESDVDWSTLPSLAKPAGATTLVAANLIAKLGPMETFWNPQDYARGPHPENQMSAYNASQCNDILQAIWFTMTSDTSAADRRAVGLRIIQIGLDVFDALESGRRWFAVNRSYGGHFMWYKLVLLYAAKVLHGAANAEKLAAIVAWLDDGTKHVFSEDWCAGIVVNREMIDSVPPTFGYTNRIQPRGYPDWMENSREYRSYPYTMRENSISYDLAYRDTQGYPFIGIALAARLLGWEATWNNPDFFEYVDTFYNLWDLRYAQGRSTATSHPYFPDYSMRWARAYYKTNSPNFTDASAPTGVRREARSSALGDYAWIEFDEPLDCNYQPAAADLAVTVAGSPVSLADVTGTISGTRSSGTTNMVTPQVTAAGLSGTVRVGMLAVSAGLYPDTYVTGVSGSTIQLSNHVPQTIVAGTPITFKSVFVKDRALVARLPAVLTMGQAVTIGYTPGATPIRNLGGAQVAAIAAAAATNRTDELPPAATTKEAAYAGSTATTRQFSGSTIVPASETVAKFMLSLRLVLKSAVASGDTFVGNYNPGSTTFRLQPSSAANLQFLFGGSANQTIVVSNFFTGLPYGTTEMDWHFIFDGTQTTQSAAKKATAIWSGGGTRGLGLVTSYSIGTLTGTWTGDPATWFATGFVVGGRAQALVGTDPLTTAANSPDWAIKELVMHWGDATLSLPANFDGAAFDPGANWGGNGELLYGIQPRLYYAGSRDEWNSSLRNRGNASKAMSIAPLRAIADTGEPVTLYTAP